VNLVKVNCNKLFLHVVACWLKKIPVVLTPSFILYQSCLIWNFNWKMNTLSKCWILLKNHLFYAFTWFCFLSVFLVNSILSILYLSSKRTDQTRKNDSKKGFGSIQCRCLYKWSYFNVLDFFPLSLSISKCFLLDKKMPIFFSTWKFFSLFCIPWKK